MRLAMAAVLLAVSLPASFAFSASAPVKIRARVATRLRGLSEWRQTALAADDGDGDEEGNTLARTPICLLPFAAEDALLPGQATSVMLKEGRFLELFQDSVDEHASMVGTVLMGEDGLLKEMPLCEIVDFGVDAGFRGKVTVRVTLQAVSRVKLVELTQTKPVMTALVTEFFDEEEAIANCDRAMLAANGIVDDIELINTQLGDNGDVSGFSHQERYRQAFQRALHIMINNDCSGNPQREKESKAVRCRSLSELQAASWSVFASAASASAPNAAAARRRHQALASTNLVERLNLGRQLLMADKCEQQFLNSGASSSFYRPNENQFGISFE